MPENRQCDAVTTPPLSVSFSAGTSLPLVSKWSTLSAVNVSPSSASLYVEALIDLDCQSYTL
jgi:hypothetical protein